MSRMQCCGQHLRSFISFLNPSLAMTNVRGRSIPVGRCQWHITNQCAEPRKSWLVWQVSSKEPYVLSPSGVYSSIIKWQVKVITLLLCFQKYLTLEKILLHFLRWTYLCIKSFSSIFFFNRYSAESQSNVSEAYSESL